jgi:hypothetical protein
LNQALRRRVVWVFFACAGNSSLPEFAVKRISCEEAARFPPSLLAAVQ